MITTQYTGLEIAVIGMSCQFHQLSNYRQLWTALLGGQECISQHEVSQIDTLLSQQPNFVNVNSKHVRRDTFDYSFFGLNHRQAMLMSPQARVLYECLWHAFEDAGYVPSQHHDRVGIFCGANSTFETELAALLQQHQNDFGAFDTTILTDKCYIATSLAYHFNLTGPAVNVDTACSTSLTALHLACQSLLSGDCQVAIAGAATILGQDNYGYLYEEGMIYSRDGHTRAFDVNASGTINSEGSAFVILKPLSKAITDKDHIHVVIKGSAINNDGRRKVGFTASSVDAQVQVIHAALAVADTPKDSIQFIEAHGSGTPMGDPIEIQAIGKAYARKTRPLKVGSIKSNLGHTIHVAGLAGFIKSALALTHEQLPASIHCSTPNPMLNLNEFTIEINQQSSPLVREHAYPLRGALNSFGIGGTNGHFILEQAPPRNNHRLSEMQSQLIICSAKTERSLQCVMTQLVAFSQENPVSANDVAVTLATGRTMCVQRSGFILEPGETIRDVGQFSGIVSRYKTEKTAFILPGLGLDCAPILSLLYQNEATFKAAVDECLLHCKQDISVLGAAVSDIEGQQLSSFMFSYAYAKLLDSWGIKADVWLGYSFGEYVSAVFHGVMSLQTALDIVLYRGQLIATTLPGKMLSVPITQQSLQLMIKDYALSIAIDNGDSCIVAGEASVVDAFQHDLQQEKIMSMPLGTDYGIHSHLMASISEPFAAFLSTCDFHASQSDYLSTVTGSWVDAETVKQPSYWLSHLQHTMYFNQALTRLSNQSYSFVIVGPGKQYHVLLQRMLDEADQQNIFSFSLYRDPLKPNLTPVYKQLLNLWLAGHVVDWNAFYAKKTGQRIPLPGYVFDDLVLNNGPTLHQLLQSYMVQNVADIRESVPIPSSQQTSVMEQSIMPPHKDKRQIFSTEYVAPTCPLEHELAALWSDFFAIDSVGIHDHFLEMGGDSLKAIRMLQLVNQKLSKTAELPIFYKQPTVAHLACILHDNARIAPMVATVETIQPLSATSQLLYAVKNHLNYNFSNQIAYHLTAEAKPLLAEFKRLVDGLVYRDLVQQDGELCFNQNKQQQIPYTTIQVDHTDFDRVYQEHTEQFHRDSQAVFEMKEIQLQDQSYVLMMQAAGYYLDGLSLSIIMNTLLLALVNDQVPIMVVPDNRSMVYLSEIKSRDRPLADIPKTPLNGYLSTAETKSFFPESITMDLTDQHLSSIRSLARSLQTTLNNSMIIVFAQALQSLQRFQAGHLVIVTDLRYQVELTSIAMLRELALMSIKSEQTMSELLQECQQSVGTDALLATHNVQDWAAYFPTLYPVIQFHDTYSTGDDMQHIPLIQSRFDHYSLPFGLKLDVIHNDTHSISWVLSLNYAKLDPELLMDIKLSLVSSLETLMVDA